MKYIFYYNTKIGRIGMEENGVAITRLDFINKDAQEEIIEKQETVLLKEAIKQLNSVGDIVGLIG